jgi:cytochrome c biogenesis protein CcmG/thiol:disulfide interchange protein DsbE
MRLLVALIAALAALAAASGGCGGGDAPAGEAVSQASDIDVGSLPPALGDLVAQSGELLGGGAEAFERRLEELRGHPVVVNKWASWCAPCRAEFPFFQSQAAKRAGEVAFIGVNSSDNEGDAATFLDEYPVPYPSYQDPELEVADVFNGVAAFPTTAFYDEQGELVYVKQGGYASEDLLAEDIERYAGGGPPPRES